MFQPYFIRASAPIRAFILAPVLALVLICAGAPLAQADNQVVTGNRIGGAVQSNARLAALSAEAGLFFVSSPGRSAAVPALPKPLPALCLRADFGLRARVMGGSQMTVEHGLIGCPTETDGLPITVSDDPAITPPPASRQGDYALTLSMRYRLMQRHRVQLIATVSDQALAYSLTSPVIGNNLLASMSLLF